MAKEPTSIAVAIGHQTARADIKYRAASITLQSTSGVDDGAFYPAQDVQIYGNKSIKQLRDFCDTVLKEQEELDATQPQLK